MNQNYRSWAEIDGEALRHNARQARDRVGPGAKLLAVVKANAYGHGMPGVAEALAGEAEMFGVANLEEAVQLRATQPHPIVIFGPALPDECAAIAGHGFVPSISTLEEAQAFSGVAGRQKVLVNFVVDTGMGRMGVLEKDALALFQKVAALPGLSVHSVSTHLPVSNEDAEFTRRELASFAQLIARMRQAVPGGYRVHVLPSAGVLAFADSGFDLVRTGLMLYGISPLPGLQAELRPVMTWKTRIALVREMPAGSSISYGRTFITPRRMRVATVSAGYADGYPRHLSNCGACMLVRGRRCALLGRVTMDLMVIDVSQVAEATAGDEVVLLGRQGDEEISAEELAERAGTITWEITTRVGSRVRRVHV